MSRMPFSSPRLTIKTAIIIEISLTYRTFRLSCDLINWSKTTDSRKKGLTFFTISFYMSLKSCYQSQLSSPSKSDESANQERIPEEVTLHC